MSLLTGIYGGSFNPIHNGHIFLAKKMLEQLGLDEIWFVVSPQNPLKCSEILLDDERRLELVRLALKDERNMIVSDYEFHMPKPSYMWNTLESLSLNYPDRSFILLIGADNWQRFDKWYKHEDILHKYKIAIYPRKNYYINDQKLPDNVKVINTQLVNISSTQIRGRIRREEQFENLVPSDVADYIVKEGLYRKR
ncbi:nicotinate (nicotinamide) nucleotide adenylyltransferase [Xylanibacter oryzae]|uniref:nicotinate (nicotinamide) nucleotide adenylyltransferase n=1 Tax=Xylanibacter oryzae TaxID=185293 RepID=UPI0005602E52|nr:nicotinate (nicotinamide) nucleotide adenylyltransferase [Xylanibacter oryzae]